MSKERELLQRCAEAFSIHNKCPNLIVEIQNLLAQPDQEPVAWKVVDKTTGDFMFSRIKPSARSYTYDEVIPLFLAPPNREPIDTRMITLEMFSEGIDIDYKNGYIAGIRFAEKEHGIGFADE